MNANSLCSSIKQTPPLADVRRAKAHLQDLVQRAQDEPEGAGLIPRLHEGAFRDLMLALADHSPFLWQLALSDCSRLAVLANADPHEAHAAIVAERAGLSRRVRSAYIGRDELVRALRRTRGAHALLVALADIGGLWTVDRVT